MKISPININFCGKYIIEGKRQDVEKASNLIYTQKRKNFYDYSALRFIYKNKDGKQTCSEIIATNGDAAILENFKAKQGNFEILKKFKGNISEKYSEILAYLFKNNENTRIVNAETALLELSKENINFSFITEGKIEGENLLTDGSIETIENGVIVSQKFKDGTTRFFNKRGVLTSQMPPNGNKEFYESGFLDNLKITSKTLADGTEQKYEYNIDGTCFIISSDGNHGYFDNRNKKKIKKVIIDENSRIVILSDKTQKHYDSQGNIIKVVKEKDGIVSERFAQGFIIRTFPDGTIEKRNETRIISRISPNGHSLIVNKDGSYFEFLPTGEKKYFDKKREEQITEEIIITDKERIVKFKDGTCKIFDNEGFLISKTILLDNGIFEETDSKGSRRIRTYPEGIVEEYKYTKIQTRKHPDGIIEIYTHNDDGSSFIERNDGVIDFIGIKDKTVSKILTTEDGKTVVFKDKSKRFYNSEGKFIGSSESNFESTTYYDSFNRIIKRVLKDKTIEIYDPGHTRIVSKIYPNREVEEYKYNPDKCCIIYKNGKIIGYLNKHGLSQKIDKVLRNKLGEIKIIFKNGTWKIYDNEWYVKQRSELLKDGTIIVYGEDNCLIEKIYPDKN